MSNTKAVKKIEILAPVGDAAMLSAAVFSGADAVYLGLTGFNARRSAGNFTPDQLAEAVSFCHARGVKVHVTLNTTLYAGELNGMADAIRDVAAAGADAVIVQDLATAALVRKIAPGLAMHASTQMSIHTLAGALECARMGFSRVILARECSLAEIAAITKECPIETEVFVHGALCMSMSGQCYMSAFLGGRSGNRGSCAGPCRLPFDASTLPDGVPGQAKHLSLKDNSILTSLPALQAAGVASAKIEGRLRPPEYVAAAVHAAVCARSGEVYDGEMLQKVFSRSGFTDGYLSGKIDKTMFGARTEADAKDSRAALPLMREYYRREAARVPVRFAVEFSDEGVKLRAEDEDGHSVSVYSEEVPQPPQKDPRESIARCLEKTGGTPFFTTNTDFAGTPGFLPAGVWNELRRNALDALLAKRSAPVPLTAKPGSLPSFKARPMPAQRKLALRFSGWAQVPQAAMYAADRLILPIGEYEKVPPFMRAKTVLELPRAMFGSLEKVVAAQIEATRAMHFAGYEANNLAHFRLCRDLPVYGGFGLNITNPLAAVSCRSLGAQCVTVLPEVTLSDMAPIDPGVPTQAFVYGHFPLMLTRACPLQNIHDCTRCRRAGQLTDRKARRFPVRCALGMRTIYNPVPLYMGDRTDELPTDWMLAYFTVETPERVNEVMQLLRSRAAFDAEFTRGLYYKGTN